MEDCTEKWSLTITHTNNNHHRVRTKSNFFIYFLCKIKGKCLVNLENCTRRTRIKKEKLSYFYVGTVCILVMLMHYGLCECEGLWQQNDTFIIIIFNLLLFSTTFSLSIDLVPDIIGFFWFFSSYFFPFSTSNVHLWLRLNGWDGNSES